MSRVVGFVGLGKMGGPMAANVAAHAGLLCFDPAGTAERAPAESVIGESVGDLARRCDTLLLSVPDGAATLDVVGQILALEDAIRVTTIIDLSTIGPPAATDAAERLAARGIAYCDGPVSGGAAGARARTISLMFGGPTAILDAHRDLLQSFAGNVFHVGELAGQGQAMKLLNNFLSATALAATSEALAFGLHHGLDLTTMVDVLNVSTGRNSATVDKFPNRIIPGRFDAGFATAHMTKDVRLFEAGAVEAGTAHRVAAAVTAVWQKTDAALPGSDFTEVWKYVVRSAAE